MSTAIVAVIIISVVVLIVVLLVVLNNRDRKKITLELLDRFSRLAMENELSFSSQEVLDNALLGLDGIQRKVLFISRISGFKYESVLIDLNEIKSCSVKNVYKIIKLGSGSKIKMEQLMDRIVLEFERRDGGKPIEVIFFQQMVHHFSIMKELEQKAKNWEAILSKLIRKEVIKIA